MPLYSPSLSNLLASLSFSTYVPPSTNRGRLEQGSNGVCVHHLSYLPTYKHMLLLTLFSVADLPRIDQGLVDGTLTGKEVDIYALFSLLCEGRVSSEDLEKLKKQVNDGIHDLGTLEDVHRTETTWSNKGGNFVPPSGGLLGIGQKAASVEFSDDVEGGKLPYLYMHVKDWRKDELGLTVMDDSLTGKDVCIGSAVVQLSKLCRDGQREKVTTVKLQSRGARDGQMSRAVQGAAVGAAVGGPAGAVVGGVVAGAWSEKVQGEVKVGCRLLPIPERNVEEKELVLGGGLGVPWRDLLDDQSHLKVRQCFYVSSDTCSAAIYRSTEDRTIILAFRGTCEPRDLITDVSIAQSDWVGHQDEKVHSGFKLSLSSISRRLKGLILDAAEGDISSWRLVVTGHSLGGALAVLMTRDLADNGLLVQGLREEGDEGGFLGLFKKKLPQGPQSLELQCYTYGSPRVGNAEFCDSFDALVPSKISSCYRVVNGQDIVPRMPRTVNALVASVGYDHCGKTVLVGDGEPWIEGVSDGKCPVRDGDMLTSPFLEGNVAGDVLDAIKSGVEKNSTGLSDKLDGIISNVSGRMQSATPLELASLAGIDVKYAQRELALLEGFVKGDGISHHMEPNYHEALLKCKPGDEDCNGGDGGNGEEEAEI